MKRRLTLVTAEETIPGDDRNIPIITADDDIAELLGEDDEDGNITPGGSIMTFEEMEALYKPTLMEEETTAPSEEIVDPAKDNGNEEEELISEESDIEYSEDEEYDEENSDVDDTDLLKRLEEKYGKLPSTKTKADNDVDLDDDDYDNDDEAEDDDIDPTWTSK